MTLDANEIAKKAMLNNLINKVPEVESYKHLITFEKIETKLKMNLTGLPQELVKKISESYRQ